MKCSFMSNALPSVQKEEDTNSEPQLDVTCEGTPCLEKTWMTKSLASSVEVMVSCVRMKMLCFDSQSMMTRMVSKLEDRGSFSMKSKEMEFQGCSRIRSCFRSHGLPSWRHDVCVKGLGVGLISVLVCFNGPGSAYCLGIPPPRLVSQHCLSLQT